MSETGLINYLLDSMIVVILQIVICERIRSLAGGSYAKIKKYC